MKCEVEDLSDNLTSKGEAEVPMKEEGERMRMEVVPEAHGP